MKINKGILFASLAVGIGFASCASHYSVSNVSRSRILIDKRYDVQPDEAATKFLAPYKAKVDSQMSPVVGHTARYLQKYRPESPLSNLLADIMVWAGYKFNEHPVIGIYNMGGIRASLPAGNVTVGDVLDVAPFENKISFLTLTGENLLKLFNEIAAVGGEAVSRGVQLEITHDGKLLSARLNGKEIDPTAKYRIATIDYLAQGNDKLDAFKQKTNYVNPQAKENDARFIITDYFIEMEKQGVVVDAKVEGRIVVK